MSSKTISYEEFSKVDLRVGKVIKAEKVPGSKKLIKLIVDLGSSERQIIAGLGKWYTPESFEGKYVIVVANLAPKSLMGYISEGMILAAGCDGTETPVLLTLEKPIKPGSKIC